MKQKAKIVGVRLAGSPKPGIGPMDVALALIAKTFANGFNKNNVLEFFGPGIVNLSMEFRMGIDVMTTESAALSSIWCTDEKTETYLTEHGRAADYQKLEPEAGAYYDRYIEIDMDTVESMIALPFHPSHALSIREFKENMETVLREVEAEGNKIKGDHGEPFRIMQHIHDGAFYPDQALVSGCAGGLFENIVAIADILRAPLNDTENNAGTDTIEGIRSLLRSGASEVELNVLDSHIQVEHEADVRALNPAELKAHSVQIIHATLDALTEEEREILMSGCLINHYKND